MGEHAHELRGEELRTIVNRALGPRAIQSTLFTVSRNRTDVVFSGAGFGHGVGLCQVGAAERARRGESLQAIVSHYFPGCHLEALNGFGRFGRFGRFAVQEPAP